MNESVCNIQDSERIKTVVAGVGKEMLVRLVHDMTVGANSDLDDDDRYDHLDILLRELGLPDRQSRDYPLLPATIFRKLASEVGSNQEAYGLMIGTYGKWSKSKEQFSELFDVPVGSL